jgi:hypothetical protein
MRRFVFLLFACTFLFHHPIHSQAWFDETHVAIAKAAGYPKWFNACGPDMIKEKIGDPEGHNHFVNNPRGIVVTPEIILAQIEKYNKIDPHGHLYGAIIASVRDYIKQKKTGKYADYHLAFCAHYVGDLSQPLHNIENSAYIQAKHKDTNGIINDEIMSNLDKINVYPIKIDTEESLIREVTRIGNLSVALGYKLEEEKRLLTKEEAYQQLSHSVSLFKGILEYMKTVKGLDN